LEQLVKTVVFLDRATLSVDLPNFPFPPRWLEYSPTTPEGSDVMDDSRPSGFGICQSGEVVTSTAKERSS
jgi:hypothetical protein